MPVERPAAPGLVALGVGFGEVVEERRPPQPQVAPLGPLHADPALEVREVVDDLQGVVEVVLVPVAPYTLPHRRAA